MKQATNFDIRLHYDMVLALLKPEDDGSINKLYDKLQSQDIHIMCKEYGDDDDWCGLTTDDYQMLLDERNETGLPDYVTKIPIELLRLVNEVEENVTKILDIPVSSIPSLLYEAIKGECEPSYRDEHESLSEDLFSELCFKKGEDEYPFDKYEDEQFSWVVEKVKSIHEQMSANGCAYVRFTEI